MDLHQSNMSLYGVAQGITSGQHERVDELNARYMNRQFCDKPLKPNFNIRSIPTKYSIFPLIDRRAPNQEQPHRYADHYSNSNFCPNMSKGPVDGFLQNVETESILRNQYFGLQRGADQRIYVPSSNSDLYKVSAVGRQEIQTHPTISAQFQFDTQLHPNLASRQIGQDTFHNNTRTQLRNTVSQ